ncbi:SDR family NAD(P)-dependent oxidoreductase [Hyphomonas sp.]|uniref:SDR family NAD(P)-dependent oxidoreductase n=1 Tax=Hyphomonas sp. TaxID=87 RepID=UPI00391C2239
MQALSAALTTEGYDVFASNVPVDAVLILSALMNDDAVSRHWNTLEAARTAKATARRIITLQSAHIPSGLDGLSRTLRKEWPQTEVFSWTLPEDRMQWTDLVLHALRSGYGDGLLTVEGQLLVPVTRDLVTPSAPPARQPGVWLVTGGARGVTAACAVSLAAAAGGTILLAGRTAETPWLDDLPETRDLKTLRGLLAARPREPGTRLSPADIDRHARALLAGAEIRDTLAAIRDTGAQAEYLVMDAGDAASVEPCITRAQARHGQITGLVHGAGVLADRYADEKTEAEVRHVFAPKVAGLENLLRHLDSAQLSHVALFSSAAAFFGNRGQSDYAMANALLTNAAHQIAARATGIRIKVFHWGPWAGGMVDTSLASHFEAQGIPLIPVEEGARIFATELLAGDPDQIELVVGEAWAAS